MRLLLSWPGHLAGSGSYDPSVSCRPKYVQRRFLKAALSSRPRQTSHGPFNASGVGMDLSGLNKLSARRETCSWRSCLVHHDQTKHILIWLSHPSQFHVNGFLSKPALALSKSICPDSVRSSSALQRATCASTRPFGRVRCHCFDKIDFGAVPDARPLHCTCIESVSDDVTR